MKIHSHDRDWLMKRMVEAVVWYRQKEICRPYGALNLFINSRGYKHAVPTGLCKYVLNRPVSVEKNVRYTYIVCMWKLSKHALLRLDERGFTQDDVLNILNEAVPSIIVASPQEETVDLYFSKIGSKYILVVVDKYSHTVITVRPLRKKEKQAFIEEVENE